MSNHRPPTDPGASIPSILTGVTATTVTLALVAYILWGPLDDRDMIGAGLGFLLAVLLLAQTVARISDRLTARDRIRTYHRRNRMEAERLARVAKRAEEPSVALLLPSEPDPVILDHWASGGERPEGYQPEPLAGPTVRRGHPSWASDETMIWPRNAGVDQTGEVGTETQRLEFNPLKGNGPSPAALRPIGVPVFRTEAERTAWADRHGLPTEVVPFQEYPAGWPDQS